MDSVKGPGDAPKLDGTNPPTFAALKPRLLTHFPRVWLQNPDSALPVEQSYHKDSR